MLSDQEIEAIALDLESELAERKQSLASGDTRERIAEAICAFANDLPDYRKPGLILIGVSDQGKPTGLPITDDLLVKLASIRDDGKILPIPTMNVRKAKVLGQDVAVIIVTPSTDTPVRFDGRVRIRVGPRRAVASRDEERILVEKRQSNDLPFDRKPVRGATLNDLDLDFFRLSYLPSAVSPDVLMENQRSLQDQLGALHFLTRTGEPNTAAILLLGRDPRAFFPNAYIQFARYEGTDMLSAIIDQKVIAGRLPEMLRDAEDTAKLHIRTAIEIEGHLTEQRRPDYPLSALQQLLRNAVMHRSYEIHAPVHWYWFGDRIEIHSPGGLFGRVTPENFGKSGPSSTDYRNQIIAEGLKVSGFVQRFGMGIPLAKQRCAENGNPPPEFEFTPSSVLAVLKTRLKNPGGVL